MNAPARPKFNTSKALFRAQSGRNRASAPTLYDDLPTQMKPDSERCVHDYYPTGQPKAIRELLERDGDAIRAMVPWSKRSARQASPAVRPT